MLSHFDVSFDVSQTNIRVVYGDISEWRADVMVSADDTQLLGSTGISRRIREKAGKKHIYHDIRKHSLPLPVGSVVVTSAGELPVKYIFHAAALDLNNHGSPTGSARAVIRRLVKQVVRLANALEARTLVTPLLVIDEISGIGQHSLASQLSGLPERKLLDFMLRYLAYDLITAQHFVSLEQITIGLFKAEEENPQQIEQDIVTDLADLKKEVNGWRQGLENAKWMILANPLLEALTSQRDQDFRIQIESRIQEERDEIARMLLPEDTSMDAIHFTESNEDLLQVCSEEEYQHKRQRLDSAIKDIGVDIESLGKEDRIHHRRLGELKQQAATFGDRTPPEITMEIEDIESKLEADKQESASLETRQKDLQLQLKKLDENWHMQQSIAQVSHGLDTRQVN